MAATHRSTAFVKLITERVTTKREPDPITLQFRFIVRMAVACHDLSVPYDLTWAIEGPRMQATITATGKIPTPKPLAKPPKVKPVSDWKPAIWDAVYRLDVYLDAKLNRMHPGFVIAHSCGLSLVHPSESGELGITESGENEDIRQGWLIIHTGSGQGFGLTLTFRRAVDAILLAASFPVDWALDAEMLKLSTESRRAGYTVKATYGTRDDKKSARRKLLSIVEGMK
jgi:hypothetical protein